MVNYKNVTKYLHKNYPDATEVAVVNRSGKNLFSTNNWKINSEIRVLLSNWASGTAQYVTLGGIRYSILQMQPERFIGTNRKKKGHLVGAATPSGNMYIIAHVNPKAKGWFHEAYPAIARAASMMESGLQIDIKVSKNSEAPPKPKKKKKKGKIETVSQTSNSGIVQSMNNSTTVLLQQRVQIDPQLKLEVENFMQWLRDPQGLATYIDYYLQYNDSYKISQLADIYNRLYRLFY
ncbi:MAG: hypothetical protein KGD57_09445 [Candidatus Lokiarchaeota archaeon]|nr:hypothetical protein [Candidatus Lokiarchaeota archaeon]